MQIALIAPPWVPVPPIGYGGTESIVDRLARGLDRAGHQVTLATTGDATCPVERRWTFEHAQIERIGSIPVEARHILFAYEHVEDADIVHDHSLIGPLLASAAGRRNVITTNHGPFDLNASEAYRRIAERIPVIAISHHQASTAYPIPIARVIHHGLDLDAFPVGAGDGEHLFFLGRMNPDKGAHRSITVARAAGVRLILAGKLREPDEKLFFESLIAPELGPDVAFVGEAHGHNKLDLIGSARALLNPIRWPEPFGLVMIEALACGTPVISLAEGAAPEIIEHGVTGFLANDESELPGFIARIDELDRAACRKAAEERFSTERMVAEHIELYEHVQRRAREDSNPRPTA